MESNSTKGGRGQLSQMTLLAAVRNSDKIFDFKTCYFEAPLKTWTENKMLKFFHYIASVSPMCRQKSISKSDITCFILKKHFRNILLFFFLYLTKIS